MPSSEGLMPQIMDALFRRVSEQPGTEATDLILELRSPERDEPALRTAIWALMSAGRIAFDENRNLVPVA